MATVHIAEYSGLAPSVGGAQVVKEPPLSESTVAISTSAVLSGAFTAETTVIRIMAGSRASFLIGASPTATTAKQPIGADAPEYKAVTPGQKISVIANP